MDYDAALEEIRKRQEEIVELERKLDEEKDNDAPGENERIDELEEQIVRMEETPASREFTSHANKLNQDDELHDDQHQ